jgi:hypothetical protein
MGNGLFVEEKYMTAENRQILELAARHGVLGQGWAHVKHGRRLQDFRDWLRWNRQFDRAYRRRLTGSWFDPL